MSETSLTSTMPRLSADEFEELSQLVYKSCGINLPPAKKVMLESRLSKRLRSLNLPTYKEYLRLLNANASGDEWVHMVDVVTTNKTDFFREPHHFEFLKTNILPAIWSTHRPLKVWSAACSSGEEPYSLALLLEDFSNKMSSQEYEIFASDISTLMLKKASSAIYSPEKVTAIPEDLKRKFLLRSKDREYPTVRICPYIRKKVKFKRINLMEEPLPVHEIFDIIFCRNVLIYFDRKTQLEVVGRIVAHLRPGGFLFIGHSESLFQAAVGVRQVKPTIYQKIIQERIDRPSDAARL